MNKNDLKRILNKLTAVADVEPFQGRPTIVQTMYGEDYPNVDYCKLLRDYSFYNEIIDVISVNGVTVPMSGGTTSTVFLSVLLQKFMIFMFLFCECKKRTRINPDFYSNIAVEEDEALRYLYASSLRFPSLEYLVSLPGWGQADENKLKKMKSALKKMFLKCQIYLKTLLTDPSDRSCDQFDFEMHMFPQGEEVEAFRPFIPPALIDELTDSFESLSPANDPVAVADCVTVPVEQIETAFSNIPSIVTMGLVGAGVLGVAFWIRKGNFTKAMAAASAIAVTSGASAAEIQALQNALRGIAGPVMRQAANGQTFCPEPGTADTSSGG